ncbi:hypothetical protein TYRP_004929 [Tyrophagus putrescentiae]|nr:hypothetical protein TYRP_004929 [Tyrophagus putrescentiae]
MRAQLGKKVAVHSAKRRGLTTLGHCERPPTRVSRAERARPESVGVHSAQVSSGTESHVCCGGVQLAIGGGGGREIGG